MTILYTYTCGYKSHETPILILLSRKKRAASARICLKLQVWPPGLTSPSQVGQVVMMIMHICVYMHIDIHTYMTMSIYIYYNYIDYI